VRVKRGHFVFGSFAAGLLLSPRIGVRAQGLRPLTVVTSASDSGGEVYYAKDLGIFERHGLDVDIISLQNGQAASAAVASGRYAIGQSNIAALAIARQHGVPVVLVAPASAYAANAATSALVVGGDSALRTAKDLIGKTIGAPGVRDIGTISIDTWARSSGVNPAQIRFIELASPALAPALARGVIDAALLVEPFLSSAVASGSRVLAYTYSAIAPRFLIAGYYTLSDWLKEHQPEAQAFAAAIAETAAWANANHSKSAEILAKYTGTPLNPRQTRPAYADRLDSDMIQPMIDAAIKDGELEPGFTVRMLLAN
jgi:NitT/TauT family transport system substrate-binding protein